MRQTVRAVPAAVLALAAGLAAGCGGKGKYVPVSGVVRVNGKPYRNAMVYFQPLGGKDDQNPGRGSAGVTDDAGRFVLRTDDGKEGATPGTHQVKVRTVEGTNMMAQFDPAKGTPDRQPDPPRQRADPIPADWRSFGEHTFEVPAGGTAEANFDLTVP